MSKKNLNSDFLTQFFDHSPNYKNKRSRGYFKFLRLQKQQQFLQLYNQFYMTFIFKPYKIVLANIAIFLVILFSIISFGFGLVTQAQNNPGASFVPTDYVDTTRLDDCNLDIAFPKKVDGVEASIYSTKGIQNLDIRNILNEYLTNFRLYYNSGKVNLTLELDCFQSSKIDAKQFLTERILKLGIKGNVFEKKAYKTPVDASKDFPLKIFDKSGVANIQVLEIILAEKDSFEEYLTFEIADYRYLIRSNYQASTTVNPTIISLNVDNSLSRIPSGFNINYNKNNDVLVNRKIVYDSEGGFSDLKVVGNEDYHEQLAIENYKKLAGFYGIFLALLVVILICINYFYKFKPKLNLQSFLRIFILGATLIYFSYQKMFEVFTEAIYFYSFESWYVYQMDAIIFGLAWLASLVILIINRKQRLDRTKKLDIIFVFIQSVFLYNTFFAYFLPFYLPQVLVGISTILSYLILVFYSIWNGFLVGKEILRKAITAETEN